jgi:hypothetical protein
VQVFRKGSIHFFAEGGEGCVAAGDGFAIGFDEGVAGGKPFGRRVCVPDLFVDVVGVDFPSRQEVESGVEDRQEREGLHPLHTFMFAGFIVPGARVNEGGLGGVRHVGDGAESVEIMTDDPDGL